MGVILSAFYLLDCAVDVVVGPVILKLCESVEI
jgi:hypothetical protein